MMLVASNPPQVVSVIIETRNPHPRYFPEGVHSILAQTLPNFELLIVKAPSCRSGRDMLTGLSDPRILYILYLENPSPAAQINHVLAEARGQFEAIEHANDLSEPVLLQKQVEYLEAKPGFSVVYAGVGCLELH